MKSSVIIVLLRYFGLVYLNLVNEQTCGIVASDNPIHQHPWLVLIEYYLNGRRALLRCGGTLISRRHVLTSAHCVEISRDDDDRWSRDITILPRLGEYNISSRRDCVAGVCSDPAIWMVVESIKVHPLFYHDRVSHDLAILILETDAPYTDFIRPICLPRRTSEIPTELFASGFGDLPNSHIPSEVKKNMRLPYYPRCPLHYEQIYKLPRDGFCAGGQENIDTCNGDSGGPIIWVREDGGLQRAELWGVIKGGTKTCGLKGRPGVYTSVDKNLLWIARVINITAARINSGMQSEVNETEGNENGGIENGEKQKVDTDNQNDRKPNEENQNDKKQDKGMQNKDENSGQILSGPNYLIALIVMFSLLCIFFYSLFLFIIILYCTT